MKVSKRLPSRQHIRNKDGRGDILHNMPSTSLSNLATPLEEPTPVGNDEEVADSLLENNAKGNKGSPQAKPRPKAAPRKKPAVPPNPSSSADQGKKQPLAAPRAQSNQDHEESPSRFPEEDEAEGRSKRSGSKPSPKKGDAGRKASPRKSRTSVSSLPQSPQRKDPSKLSIQKKKALLAQNVLLNTQDKPKPGAPPVHRKPKPVPTTPASAGTSSDSQEPKTRLSGTEQQGGSTSTAEEVVNVKPSPMNKKKLPPGAFNMMMMGGMPGLKSSQSPETSRHAMVSSIPVSRAEPEAPLEEGEGRKEADNESGRMPMSQLQSKLLKKMSVDEGSSSDAGSTTASPLVQPKFKARTGSTEDVTVAGTDAIDTGEPAAVDYDVVLTWTPDVTAAWLGQVELASYQQLFLEKGIQGYMLFDMDGHKLKVQQWPSLCFLGFAIKFCM